MLKKIARKSNEYRHRFEYSLMDSKLIPSTQNYRRFVIVCGIRTGSTMLCSLLSSHPQTRTFFEVFHRYAGSTPFQVPGYQAKSGNAKISRLRHEDPVHFLSQEVWRKHPRRIKAVGFKLLYTQARNVDPWWNGAEFDRWWETVGRPPTLSNARSNLWSYLKESPDIHIIHLRRQNLLKRVASTINAQTSGNWGIGATGGVGKKCSSNQFHLDFNNCLQDFEAIRRMEDEADEFFDGKPKLNITYEELISDSLKTTRKVQDFLGITTLPLLSETKQQITKHLSEIVTNYSELKMEFSNTPWHSFF